MSARICAASGGLAGDNPPGRDETAAHNRRFGELLEAIDAAPQAVIHNARTHDRSAQLDAGAVAFTDCLFGDEGREGIRAFLDKRAPYWNKT